MAESYIERWAREQREAKLSDAVREQKTAEQKDEKVVSADAAERKGQAEKKTKSRRKQTSMVKESDHC